jgi:hypothetical protein
MRISSMRTGFPVSPVSKSWKELYRAALVETDKSKVSERIAQAELAIGLRARELFHTDKEFLQERQAVDAATHGLQSLRSTITAKKSGDRTGRSEAA